MQLNPNHLLQGDKYRIIKVLGQGGFGISYLAEQVLMERNVCIKELFLKEYCNRDESTSQVSLGTANNRAMLERYQQKFLKEARMIARLDHPNIIRIFDVFTENNTAYYVMDYIEGKNLNDLVKERGALPEAEAVSMIRQVGEGLAYVHAHKINHLDIKPGNIMLRKDGRPVLIDFGMSKQYDEKGDQTSSTPIGVSSGYAPLEMYQVGGVNSFSPQTDIYELAATLYRLVTGQIPPSASDVMNEGLPKCPESVSEPTWQAIEKAMSFRKRERPDTMHSFLAMLPKVSNSLKVAAAPVFQPSIDEESGTQFVDLTAVQETEETVLVSEMSKDPRQDYLKYCDEYKELPYFLTKETVDSLQPLLEESSHNGDKYATLLLAELLIKMGRPQDGLVLLDSLSQADDQDIARWAQYYRADCLAKVDKNRAIELLESLRDRNHLPGDRFSELVWFGLCELKDSDTAQDLSWLLPLESSRFSDISNWARYVHGCLLMNEKPEEAMMILKTVAGSPQLLSAVAIGLIQYKLGDFSSAQNSIMGGIERLEKYCNVHQWGYVYAFAGDIFVNKTFEGHDDEKAYSYYLKGANASNVRCMFSVGWMLLKGIGCHKDYNQSSDWLEKAKAKGVPDEFAIQLDEYLNKAICLRDKKPWYDVYSLEYETKENMSLVYFSISAEIYNVSNLRLKAAILKNGKPVYSNTKMRIPLAKTGTPSRSHRQGIEIAVLNVYFDFDESELGAAGSPVHPIHFTLEVTLTTDEGSPIVRLYPFSISTRSHLFRHDQWYNLKRISVE